MRREQQFLQDKIDRRRADFKLVQDRVRAENERQLKTQRELRTQVSELHNSLEVRTNNRCCCFVIGLVELSAFSWSCSSLTVLFVCSFVCLFVCLFVCRRYESRIWSTR